MTPREPGRADGVEPPAAPPGAAAPGIPSAGHMTTTYILLAAMLIAGLALRIAWVLVADTQLSEHADPEWYFATASNLAAGHGVTVTQDVFGAYYAGPGGHEAIRWPQGYPITIGAVFLLVGTSLNAGLMVNAVAGAALIPITYLIARRLQGERIGLVAAALTALYPAHIVWSSVYYSDVLFAVPFGLAIALSLPRTAERAIARALLVGLLIGYAATIRPQAVVLVPLVLIYWHFRAAGSIPLARAGLAAAVGTALILVPLSVWNTVRTDSPTFVSKNFGYNLRIGHAPYATGRYTLPEDLWATVDPESSQPSLPDEGIATRRAIRYALTHPLHELELSARKVYYLYTTDSDSLVWATNFGKNPLAGSMELTSRLYDAMDVFALIFLLLALASLPRTLTLRGEMLLLWLVLASWTALHIVFFGEPRYRLPILPLLATLVACTLVRAWDAMFPAEHPPA